MIQEFPNLLLLDGFRNVVFGYQYNNICLRVIIIFHRWNELTFFSSNFTEKNELLFYEKWYDEIKKNARFENQIESNDFLE